MHAAHNKSPAMFACCVLGTTCSVSENSSPYISPHLVDAEVPVTRACGGVRRPLLRPLRTDRVLRPSTGRWSMQLVSARVRPQRTHQEKEGHEKMPQTMDVSVREAQPTRCCRRLWLGELLLSTNGPGTDQSV